jgi:CMP-N-acetylneuraminic acid synthetase
MMPLITVYITNHNYAKYVGQAVESVLNQTFQDFELIVIDDGSTDGSRSVIEKYVDHPAMRIVWQENKGLNVSNNIALRLARGKYVMRLDADDYLDEHALSVLSGVLERKPEIGLVFPDYWHVDGEGQIIEQVRRHDFRKDVTLLDSPAHGACTMIRTQWLKELGGYTEETSCQDGYDLWLRFVRQHPVENVNLPLFYYRRHDRNLTGDETRIMAAQSKIIRKHAERVAPTRLKTLALIPVRGPSVDPTSVALAGLGDKTFLDWTIEAALRAANVDWTVVSSSDEAVLEYVGARYAGRVAVSERPVKLARANVPLYETWKGIVDKHAAVHGEPDALMSLFVECPFRSSEYVDKAVDMMRIFDLDAVVGVRVETDVLYQHKGGGLEPVKRGQGGLRLEREELYRQVGGMGLCRYRYFAKHHKTIGGRIGSVVLDQKAALRVASELDLKFARMIAETEVR